MIKHIEFLGPPGVGKSTLFFQICCRRKRRQHWLTTTEAIRKCTILRNNRGLIKKSFDYLVYAGLHTPVVSKYIDRCFTNFNKKALLRTFIDYHPDFFHYAISSICHSCSSDYRRVTALHQFLSVIEDHTLVNTIKTPFTVISDESIAQRVYTLISQKQNYTESETVQKYFNMMPKPIALIYVDAETEVILKRIRTRHEETGRLNFMHQNLSSNTLKTQCDEYRSYARMGAKLLRDRNVPVLEILGSNNFEANVKNIIDFITYTDITNES